MLLHPCPCPRDGTGFLSPARCPPSPESPGTSGMFGATSTPHELHVFCLQGHWLLALLTMKVQKIPRVTCWGWGCAEGHTKANGGKAKKYVKPLNIFRPEVAPTWMHTQLPGQLPL